MVVVVVVVVVATRVATVAVVAVVRPGNHFFENIAKPSTWPKPDVDPLGDEECTPIDASAALCCWRIMFTLGAEPGIGCIAGLGIPIPMDNCEYCIGCIGIGCIGCIGACLAAEKV